jgi:hypothetical protein
MPNDKGLKAIPIHMVHNLQQLPIMFEILKPHTKDRDSRAKDIRIISEPLPPNSACLIVSHTN